MVWVTTEAFFVSTDICQPDVGTGFGAGTGCLGHDKGPFVSLQSFPQAGLFLSRKKILCRDRVCRGGVATKSFMSRPTDLPCVRDKAMGARTTGLGTRMNARTSGGAACATKPTTRKEHYYAHNKRDRDFIATETSLSR